MARSIWIALAIATCIAAFFIYGTLIRGPAASAGDATAAIEARRAAQPTVLPVVVTPAGQQLHTVYLELKGRTEADRMITVRSETTGQVVSAPVTEGTAVKRGTLLCGLDLAARNARIAEAEAAVRSAMLDHAAARKLADDGWASEGQAASLKAALDSANAALDAAKIELSHTQIRAPFDGIFEERLAERGDFLTMGTACGTLVDLDPIKVAVDVSEDYAGRLKLGTPVDIRLSSGASMPGKVQFSAVTADPNTRTFRVFAEAPNPDGQIASGLSANVKIEVGEAPATPIAPALLTLHDDGRIGVRHVDAQSRVQFTEVTIIDDANGVLWVIGLPAETNILATGQDYVSIGAKVEAKLVEASGR
ncbi:MAG: efflux RND transporter periplasmic adaptor subunit [Pseudomonadota bacterium]